MVGVHTAAREVARIFRFPGDLAGWWVPGLMTGSCAPVWARAPVLSCCVVQWRASCHRGVRTIWGRSRGDADRG